MLYSFVRLFKTFYQFKLLFKFKLLSKMSKFITKINSNNKPIIKPYCKVCHDAGKPEREYTSHFVRETPEPTSKVVCPTLLQQKCSYCSKPGHTVKYCKDVKKSKEKRVTQPVEVKKPAKTSVKQPSNLFTALYDESEDEELDMPTKQVASKEESVKPVKAKEEFPALCLNMPKKTTPIISGYAAIASKSKADYDKEKYEQKLIETSIKRQIPQTKAKNKVTFAKEEYEVEKSVIEIHEDLEMEEEEPVTKIYSNRIMKASDPNLDWAALDSDSDSDEDWYRDD